MFDQNKLSVTPSRLERSGGDDSFHPGHQQEEEKQWHQASRMTAGSLDCLDKRSLSSTHEFSSMCKGVKAKSVFIKHLSTDMLEALYMGFPTGHYQQNTF
ncbi:hypothetical protein ElyMa_006678100 [Elysia marginata]|uniref:Uncharacterized protein n=1 Tax=Elysia marginata TaxID=1093978 RepID=A0AAV4ISI2_9GAST|nr:hypothetical protein ElyMa_006678100 [Elysia marginata]